MLFIWEPHEAHGSLRGTAAPPRPGDGVADAAIRQPARIAAVVSQKFPGCEDLAHFCDLSTVVETGLHRFVVGQLGGVDQVVKPACGEKGRESCVGLLLSCPEMEASQTEVFPMEGRDRAMQGCGLNVAPPGHSPLN